MPKKTKKLSDYDIGLTITLLISALLAFLPSIVGDIVTWTFAVIVGAGFLSYLIPKKMRTKTPVTSTDEASSKRDSGV